MRQAGATKELPLSPPSNQCPKPFSNRADFDMVRISVQALIVHAFVVFIFSFVHYAAHKQRRAHGHCEKDGQSSSGGYTILLCPTWRDDCQKRKAGLFLWSLLTLVGSLLEETSCFANYLLSILVYQQEQSLNHVEERLFLLSLKYKP